MRQFILMVLFISFALAGCKTLQTNASSSSLKALYQASITNSMSPAPDKVYKNLVGINPQNKNLIRKKIHGEDYILVVSWKSDTIYYQPDSLDYYNTKSYPIWVTTAPELLERMQKENPKDIDLRLKQLLGLPPNAVYKYFIEFWVRPQDLFRPCPDQDISDKACDLCFPQDADSTYIAWVNENRISRYYPCELYDKYPWTQLGYTYDWNPKNTTHIGLSEFVIKPHKYIVIKKKYTTKDYLKNAISSLD